MEGNRPPLPLWIGWKEMVDFPAWGLPRVRGKVDTGARTSALGVVRYELRESAAGTLIRMLVAPYRPPRRPSGTGVRQVWVETPVLRMVQIRNSGGSREERPVVATEVCLGPVRKRIELTITHRPGMRFPLLLGRRALEDDFLVDVRGAYLLRARSP